MCVTVRAGKPKGVLHTTGGYMVYTYTTVKWVLGQHGNPARLRLWLTGCICSACGCLGGAAARMARSCVASRSIGLTVWLSGRSSAHAVAAGLVLSEMLHTGRFSWSHIGLKLHPHEGSFMASWVYGVLPVPRCSVPQNLGNTPPSLVLCHTLT